MADEPHSIRSQPPAPIINGYKNHQSHNSSPPDVSLQGAVTGTVASIYQLPSVYLHRNVLLVDEKHWKWAWETGRFPRSAFPENAVARTIADCDWYLSFSNAVPAGACISSAEANRIIQLGKSSVWRLPYADLLCYVEDAKFGSGFLLTHCKAIPVPLDVEIARENQFVENER